MKDEYKHISPAKVALLIIIVVWLIALLASCTTQRTATKYFDNHGFEGAHYCATRYPADSFYRPGKTIRDTTIQYVEGKEIPCPLPALDNLPADFKTPTVKCPPGTIVTITEHIRDTVGMVDKAKYKDLQGQLAARTMEATQLSTKLERMKKGRNTWRWIGILFGCMFLIENAAIITVKAKLV